MKRWLAGVLIIGFIAVVGCRKPMKIVLTKDQRARIAENILKVPPKPMFVSNANFDDKVQILGVDLDPKTVSPGQQLRITYYWKCLKKVSGPWKIFVHLELPGGRRIVLDHQAIHELYPVENWKPGQIIRDVQEVTIPKDAKPGVGSLWVGLFNWDVYKTRGGGDRMPLKSPGKSVTDGHNRVRVATLQVLKGKKSAVSKKEVNKKRTIVAYKVVKGITVDGDLSDMDWKTATFYDLKDASGRPGVPAEGTKVAVLYDDKYLYIAFKVMDSDISSEYKNRDDTLWKQDVVEVYLDGKMDGKDYIELQVSPNNVVFDALFKSHRNPAWQQAKAYNVKGLKTAVKIKNTSPLKEWDVEIGFPWSEIKGVDKVKQGLELTVNFFRINYNKGRIVSALAFSPAGGDFHNLDRAAILKLGPKLSDLANTRVRVKGFNGRIPRIPIGILKNMKRPIMVPKIH